MAYAYSEFPNSGYHKIDYHEMFKLYCEVRDKYAGTLDEISKLNTKLDKYMQDKRSEIDIWMNVQRAYINSEINGKTEELYQNLFTMLNNKMIEYIRQIQRTMDSFTTSVNSNINSMNTEIANMKTAMSAFETKVNGKLTEFAVQYRELDSYIRQTIDDISDNLDSEIEYIKTRLPSIDNETFNFYWNLISTIQGMTAKEWYDYVVMTCEDWNNSKITCSEWFTRSKKLTGYDSYMSLMFSPFTGELASLAQIVTEIWSNMKIGAITAGEYDGQEWTAQEIDQLRESVSAYDWAGDVFFKKVRLPN